MLPMQALGDTGLSVSRIGLGLAALGRPGYINLGHQQDLTPDHDIRAMEAQTHAVLNAAWQQGVRYIDAARSYGKAEAFLSSWLKTQADTRGLVVGSKWGYTYTADWQVNAEHHEIKEHSLSKLTEQWPQSTALLGEHLKLYQIHSATLESGVLDNQEVLEKLAQLKQEGVFIGLSLSGEHQQATLEKALRVQVNKERLFSAVQATFNLLESSLTQTLELARSEGLGVIVKEALANGRLTSRNQHASFVASRQVLEEEAARYGVAIDALALAFVLQHPWVDIALSGASTIAQLNSNVQACTVTLQEESFARLKTLQETPEQYWRTRANLSWN